MIVSLRLLCAVLLLLAGAACQRPVARPEVSGSLGAQESGASPVATVPQSHAYAGWYVRHGGQATFQPCGEESTWTVGQGADLASRARAFGLLDDTPVYVRLSGTRHGDVFDVASVVQFGAPAPVRDCAMTGVVTKE